MRRTEAIRVRTIKFLDILGRYEAAEFSQVEAAQLLDAGEQTFRRWCQRFEDAREAGLLDRRPGQGVRQTGSGGSGGAGASPIRLATKTGQVK